MCLQIALTLLAITQCYSMPCGNIGGLCFPGGACTEGFIESDTAANCANQADKCCMRQLEKCTNILDLTFVLDVSGSIDNRERLLEQTFVNDIGRSFVLKQNAVHTGIVTFDTTAVTEATLTTSFTQTEFTDKLFNIRAGGSSTATHRGVQEGQKVIVNGGRDNVPKVMLLFTDGLADTGNTLLEDAKNAKDAGTIIMTVGIENKGFSANTKRLIKDELEKTASKKELFFSISDFEGLSAAVGQVAKAICDEGDPVTTPSPPRSTLVNSLTAAPPTGTPVIPPSPTIPPATPTTPPTGPLPCEQLGGVCLKRPSRTCPSDMRSPGLPKGKCKGKDMKCCIPLTPPPPSPTTPPPPSPTTPPPPSPTTPPPPSPTTAAPTTPPPGPLMCDQVGGECLRRPSRDCPSGWRSPGLPKGKCTGRDMKCCIREAAPQTECEKKGGKCFDNKRCPSGWKSAGRRGGKCPGKGRKCCIRK